jgi:hypothetical protein
MNKKQRKRKEKKARHQGNSKPRNTLLMDREGSQDLETEESTKAKATTHSKPNSRMRRFKEWLGHEKSFTDWTVAGFTAVLALFAICQGIAIWGQWREMKLDQRAWLSMSTSVNPIAKDMPITALIHVENIGKTPAKHVLTEVVIEKLKVTDSPSFDYVAIVDNSLVNLIFPRSVDEWIAMRGDRRNPPKLTDTELGALKNGDYYVAVFAKVSFSDVNNTPHWVHFCAWKTFDESGKLSAVQTRVCTEYNDIDNN